MRDKPRRRRFAVNSSDGNQGNAAVLPLGKEHGNDGFADRTRLAGGRFQVHAQTRSGIDLDNGAALFLQWLADVHSHDIDTGNVQTDGAGGLDGAVGGFWMNAIRYIRCRASRAEIAVAADQYALTRGRHR